jgi:hypothetical protein
MQVHGIQWGPGLRVLSTVKKELVFQGKYGTLIYHNNKHGDRRTIPPRRERPQILATVRNPYDLLVSQYEYGWWKRREFRRYFRAVPNFRSRYAHFPALSFAEYVELSEQAFQRTAEEVGSDCEPERPGLLTREFIRFYCRTPEHLLARIGRGDLCIQELRSQLQPIRFLRTARLNLDLHDFLQEMGYDPTDLAFIPSLGKILPGKGRADNQRWQGYFTPELLHRTRWKERVLFELFPDFDEIAMEAG